MSSTLPSLFPKASSGRRDLVRLRSYSADQCESFVAWMRSDPAALTFVAKSFPELSKADPEQLFERFAELELIYIVRRESRGCGVATEAVKIALTSPGLDRVSAIVAFINPQNAASRRVVEKAGFQMKAQSASECRVVDLDH